MVFDEDVTQSLATANLVAFDEAAWRRHRAVVAASRVDCVIWNIIPDVVGVVVLVVQGVTALDALRFASTLVIAVRPLILLLVIGVRRDLWHRPFGKDRLRMANDGRAVNRGVVVMDPFLVVRWQINVYFVVKEETGGGVAVDVMEVDGD